MPAAAPTVAAPAAAATASPVVPSASPAASTPTTGALQPTATRPHLLRGPGFALPATGTTVPGAASGVSGATAGTGTGDLDLSLAGTRQPTAGARPAVTRNAGPLARLRAGRSVSRRAGLHGRLGVRGINHPASSFLGNGTVARLIRFIPTWIWILMGTLLLLAASAGAAAAWSAREAKHSAALVAEVSAAALTDPLTGVLNRRGFVNAFERELDRARRYGRPLALAFLDVRGLKTVNDRYGHLAGDRLLKDVAGLLQESARAHDVVGRIGGDELAVLLPEQSAAGVARVVQRVRAQVPRRRSMLGFGSDWDLTVGVSLFPEDGDAVEDLFGTADRRLYEQRGIELR